MFDRDNQDGEILMVRMIVPAGGCKPALEFVQGGGIFD
jgi:hypothetical protein